MLHKLITLSFSTLLFLTFYSCQKSPDALNLPTEGDELLSELRSYNQSRPYRPKTKSWDMVKSVAREDAFVAGQSFEEGFAVGAIAGMPTGVGAFPIAVSTGTIYGLFTGVAASRQKFNDCHGYQVIPNDVLFQKTLTALVVDRALNANVGGNENQNNNDVQPIFGGQILLPISYAVCDEIGRSHNAGLSIMMNNQTYPSYNYEDYFNEVEVEIIESSDFYNYFSSLTGFDSFEESTISDQIITLFFEAFDESVSDTDDLDVLINYYISAIENSGNLLSTQDHYSLYTTFMVLAYSTRYWESFYSNLY